MEKITVSWDAIESVIPYEQNSRIHGEVQIERLAKSLSEYGWTIPILVDENRVILAGHKRRLAAINIGMKKIPVIVKTGLTEEQKRAYRIIDNKSTIEAEWDKDALQKEFEHLIAANYDVTPFMAVDFDIPAINEVVGKELETTLGEIVPVAIFKIRIPLEDADSFEGKLSNFCDELGVKYERA